MHPRGGPAPWSAARGRHVRALLDFVRAQRTGASARGGRALLARHGHQLLGRLVERDDAPARCHALSRTAASGAPRGRNPDLRRARARGRAARRGDARRASRRARRRGRRQVRAAAGREPVDTGAAAALRGAAMERRAGSHAAAREAPARVTRAWTAWTGTGRRQRIRRPPRSTTRCVCWRRSIRWCGIAGGSRCSGAGRIASRPTRRCRSGSSGTTRSRCCGETASSAGATSP